MRGHQTLRDNCQHIANMTNEQNTREDEFKQFLLDQSGIDDDDDVDPSYNWQNPVQPEVIDSLQDRLTEQKQDDAFAEQKQHDSFAEQRRRNSFAEAAAASSNKNNSTSNGQEASFRAAPTSYKYNEQDAAALVKFAAEYDVNADADDDSSLGGEMSEEERSHFADLKE